MKQVIILEDEQHNADRLNRMIQKLMPDAEVVAMLQSVGQAKIWLRENSPPDLAFFDIQLGDGLCFDVFADYEQLFPIIFTTAFDHYAIKAFKFNSLDYLLKPVEEEDLTKAIQKFEYHNGQNNGPMLDLAGIGDASRMITGDFKKRFLVKIGDQYKSVNIEETAYFYSTENQSYLYTKSGRHFPIDYSIEQLSNLVNPMDFFRVNRKLLVSIEAIAEVHSYFNSRLLLKLNPSLADEIIVSRDRVKDFKQWMDV